MGRVYYNKLIRDGIPEKIEKKGEQFEVRELVDDQEFQQELLKKVAEEAGALSRARTREDFLSEYADLMVVLDSLARELEVSESDIKVAIEGNLNKKGGYKRRHYLHWSEDMTYKSNESVQGIKN